MQTILALCLDQRPPVHTIEDHGSVDKQHFWAIRLAKQGAERRRLLYLDWRTEAQLDARERACNGRGEQRSSRGRVPPHSGKQKREHVRRCRELDCQHPERGQPRVSQEPSNVLKAINGKGDRE
jgi:hypothetical protein